MYRIARYIERIKSITYSSTRPLSGQYFAFSSSSIKAEVYIFVYPPQQIVLRDNLILPLFYRKGRQLIFLLEFAALR